MGFGSFVKKTVKKVTKSVSKAVKSVGKEVGRFVDRAGKEIKRGTDKVGSAVSTTLKGLKTAVVEFDLEDFLKGSVNMTVGLMTLDKDELRGGWEQIGSLPKIAALVAAAVVTGGAAAPALAGYLGATGAAIAGGAIGGAVAGGANAYLSDEDVGTGLFQGATIGGVTGGVGSQFTGVKAVLAGGAAGGATNAKLTDQDVFEGAIGGATSAFVMNGVATGAKAGAAKLYNAAGTEGTFLHTLNQTLNPWSTTPMGAEPTFAQTIGAKIGDAGNWLNNNLNPFSTPKTIDIMGYNDQGQLVPIQTFENPTLMQRLGGGIKDFGHTLNQTFNPASTTPVGSDATLMQRFGNTIGDAGNWMNQNLNPFSTPKTIDIMGYNDQGQLVPIQTIENPTLMQRLGGGIKDFGHTLNQNLNPFSTPKTIDIMGYNDQGQLVPIQTIENPTLMQRLGGGIKDFGHTLNQHLNPWSTPDPVLDANGNQVFNNSGGLSGFDENGVYRMNTGREYLYNDPTFAQKIGNAITGAGNWIADSTPGQMFTNMNKAMGNFADANPMFTPATTVATQLLLNPNMMMDEYVEDGYCSGYDYSGDTYSNPYSGYDYSGSYGNPYSGNSYSGYDYSGSYSNPFSGNSYSGDTYSNPFTTTTSSNSLLSMFSQLFNNSQSYPASPGIQGNGFNFMTPTTPFTSFQTNNYSSSYQSTNYATAYPRYPVYSGMGY